MQAFPFVSIVTPTWSRHQLLLERCIPSVEAQEYTSWEHVIVADGPDIELGETLRSKPNVRFAEMAAHDPNVLWGNRARIVGQQMARGEVIAHLDDDNAWRPDHLVVLVSKLLQSRADFVYSRMLRHPIEDVIGSAPPRYAQVDTSIIVHWKSLLEKANWIPHPERRDPDWELVEHWIEAGATWAHVPAVTCDYFMGNSG